MRLLTVVLCKVVPVDDDEVCQICKDMVGQARDTLESNETQVKEDLSTLQYYHCMPPCSNGSIN
jgi:hypothetical protein